MRQHDRTTAGLSALVDVPEPDEDNWYVVLSLEGDQGSSRVVPVPDGAEIVIGRMPSCDIVIDHDAASRRHAKIKRRGAALAVEDLGSRNGTQVNGQAISGPRRLAAGDRIAIGPATAVVGTTTARRLRAAVGSLTDLEERLGAEVDRALRYHRTLGLIMLRLEGPGEAAVTYVDRIAGELRRMDLLAEYGPDELAVVLPEADADATVVVARRLAALAERIKVTVGTAAFPADGTGAGELLGSARAALRGARTRRERDTTTGKVAVGGRLLVVADPVMKQVFQLARQCATSMMTVLVVGETGAGKEAVAEAVHTHSPRAEGPYVRLNCASLPETLLEAELFGHEKGAFTGANRQKMGYFEAAGGGTLFLDELGELPLGAQAKLLRVLEHKRIVRVGGTRELPVDVRLVCATNRDLEAEVVRGRFRQDLYFRISAFVIPVPPLRDRKVEIEPLARAFARDVAAELGQKPPAITGDALAILVAHEWPGNVRELRNAIERAVVLAGGGAIEPHHLPDRVRDAAPSRQADDAIDVRGRVSAVERDAVLAALDAAGGNQTHAARRLGLSRFALIRLLEKHGLKPRKR